MKTLPVISDGKRIGEAETERDRLYMRVTVRTASRRGLWCAWGIGERGETRIGILEPVNGESVISRRFSRRSLADAGEFSRVELRPANVQEEAAPVKEARTHTPERISGQHTPERVAERHTPESVSEGHTPERVSGRHTPESASEGHTPERVSGKHTPESASEGHTPERVSGRHTPERVEEARTHTETTTPENAEAWRRTGTARLFRSVRFQRQLRNVREALTRGDGERRKIALIREEDAPFPIPELFCLATPARIETRNYWVFTFDRQEWPVL